MAKKIKISATVPLLGYLDELVDKLRQLVPAAVADFDADAIHAARVITRRLKAAIDVLRPAIDDSQRRPFAHVLRRLRRRLGPLRDLDVMIGHLKTLNRGRAKTGGQWLIVRLETQRQNTRNELAKKTPIAKLLASLGQWWGVRQNLAGSAAAIDSLLAESLHAQLDDFSRRADLLSGGAKAQHSGDPHQIRIAGKALRYTLEMAAVQGHPLPKSVAKAFKKMQDALGLWHDYVVLAEQAMRHSLETELALHDPDAQAVVLEVMRLGVQRAGRQLDLFRQLWSARGAELSAMIRQAVPLPERDILITADINAPQTDRDPAGLVETAQPADVLKVDP